MGKPKIRPPRRVKTPDMIEKKFGILDYVGQMTPHAKFNVNLTKRASWKIGEIYAKVFVAIYLIFQKLTYRSDTSANFCTQWIK